jgi:uncharacterized membrane protein YjdF
MTTLIPNGSLVDDGRPREATGGPSSTRVRSGWRRIADLLRVTIAVIAIVAAARGDTATAIKCMLLLPAAVGSRFVGVPPPWQVAFSLALAVEAVGSAAAFNTIGGWDTVAHLVLPFLSGPFLYGALERVGLRTDVGGAGVAGTTIAAGLVTFTGVLAIGALWELIEWAADTWFGTQFAKSYGDTVTDLLHDAIAALASGFVVAHRSRPVTWRPG